MALPRLERIASLPDTELLSGINECQNAFEDDETDPVLAYVTSSHIYKELRRRGMTDLAIESFIRNLPNWRKRQ